jgi:hypothetical protein
MCDDPPLEDLSDPDIPQLGGWFDFEEEPSDQEEPSNIEWADEVDHRIAAQLGPEWLPEFVAVPRVSKEKSERPTFMGARDHYFFSSGHKGVGYYRDDCSNLVPSPVLPSPPTPLVLMDLLLPPSEAPAAMPNHVKIVGSASSARHRQCGGKRVRRHKRYMNGPLEVPPLASNAGDFGQEFGVLGLMIFNANSWHSARDTLVESFASVFFVPEARLHSNDTGFAERAAKSVGLSVYRTCGYHRQR